jgi:REP-associated tyrosine transposase
VVRVESDWQRLSDIRYYLIWATRRRRAFLEGPVLDRASALFAEAAGLLDARVTEVASGGDYVIVTVDSPPDLSPALLVSHLKRHSAGRLRAEYPQLRSLPSIWTRRFFATTREDVGADRIAQFLKRQPRDERQRLPHPDDPGLPARVSGEPGVVEIRRLPPLGPHGPAESAGAQRGSAAV